MTQPRRQTVDPIDKSPEGLGTRPNPSASFRETRAGEGKWLGSGPGNRSTRGPGYCAGPSASHGWRPGARAGAGSRGHPRAMRLRPGKEQGRGKQGQKVSLEGRGAAPAAREGGGNVGFGGYHRPSRARRRGQLGTAKLSHKTKLKLQGTSKRTCITTLGVIITLHVSSLHQFEDYLSLVVTYLTPIDRAVPFTHSPKLGRQIPILQVPGCELGSSNPPQAATDSPKPNGPVIVTSCLLWRCILLPCKIRGAAQGKLSPPSPTTQILPLQQNRGCLLLQDPQNTG